MVMIVAGIDGSEGAARALEFAAREAELRDSDLRIVCAWHVPPQLYAGTMLTPAISPEALVGSMRAAAEKQVAEVLAAHADVRHELVLREGNAAVVLAEESERAELLVVGSRGRGGFAGLLLGSVGQQTAMHALCPVVIVPAHARQTPAD
jgi:nucleotide-binding universal stress UspA family protein